MNSGLLPFDDLWVDICRLSLQARKCLITLARAQVYELSPSDTILQEKVKPFFREIRALVPPLKPTTLEYLRLFLPQPHMCGLIISLALSASISSEQAEVLRKESCVKEFSACMASRRPSSFNWDVFFDIKTSSEALHQSTQPRPLFNARILAAFEGWKRRLNGRTIFPHTTKNGVSRNTQDNAVFLGVHTVEEGFVTNEDLVRHYIRTGTWVDGKVGLRQKHYPTGLTPRTYFSTGGRTLFYSMYLRDILNEITDMFDPTNRYLRVSPNRLQCPQGGHFIIYDLTSFTSKFSEQVPFLHALSSFLSGTVVRVVGPHLYTEEVDVGILVQEYIEHCNDFPDFAVEVPYLTDELGRFCHATAGFLGVYGNLTTCTLPHGLAAAQHAESESHLSCAGDDACEGVRDTEHARQLLQTVLELGELQEEKVYDSRQTSVYLKRPFNGLGGNGLIGDMCVWPLLSMATGKVDDTRYSHMASLSSSELRCRMASSCYSFMVSFSRLTRHGLTDIEREASYHYLSTIYRRVGLPIRGYLPQCSRSNKERLSSAVFPMFDESCVELTDPLTTLIDHAYTGSVEVPSFGEYDTVFDGGLREGVTFTAKSSKPLRFMEKMGYLYKTRDTITLVGDDGYLALHRMFTEPSPKVYNFHVLEDVSPNQLISLGLLENPYTVDVVSYGGLKRKYFDWDEPNRTSWKRLRYDPDSSDSDGDEDETMFSSISEHRLDRNWFVPEDLRHGVLMDPCIRRFGLST